MKQIITQAVVLARTDFQEADRILTMLTPDNGKLRVIAKGVRRPRSKLAGGIELLSVNDVTVLPGRGELGTLISSRLDRHFGNIVRDISRTMLAYDLLKKINRITEEAADEEYFWLLQNSLTGLNDPELTAGLAELWFAMQLLKITGRSPNLKTDSEGNRLQPDQEYSFDFDNMAFRCQKDGLFTANHIKLFRLSQAAEKPTVLKQLTDAEAWTQPLLQLANSLLKQTNT